VDGSCAYGHDANAVLDPNLQAGVGGGEFDEQAAHYGFGHGLVGFVNEGRNRSAILLASHASGEFGQGAHARIGGDREWGDHLVGDEDFDLHGSWRAPAEVLALHDHGSIRLEEADWSIIRQIRGE
jgi:hypothetical protein